MMFQVGLTFAIPCLLCFAGILYAAEKGDVPSTAPSNAPFLVDVETFLRDLRLDKPELAPVKAAIGRGDITEAGRAYVAYFRKKPMSWPLWTDWSSVKRDPNFDAVKADGLLAGHLWDGYSVYEVPAAGIDWRNAPLTCITRFPIFPCLSDAYFHKQDPKYARFITDHIHEYMKAYPIDEFVGKGSFGFVGNNMVSRPWHWSMMPKRVEELTKALVLIRSCPQVSDDELLAIVHRAYQEAIYCRLAMKRWVDKRHNGGKSYIHAVTHACKLLEDFKASDEWGAYSADLLVQYINQSFYPDGQCVEMATSYSGNAGYSVQELASLLKDRPGIRAARPRLAAMVDWSIGLSMPSGRLPSFGDLSARHVSGVIYEPLLDWLDVPYARTILGRTNEGVPEGPLPPTVWPPPGKDAWCGYYTMRSDWTERARYLCFSAGPRGISGHEHADKLSFVLSAFGADFIIDPTSTSYRNNERDSFISVQSAGFLHNTVTVDGVDEFCNVPTETKTPLQNRWEHGDHYTLVEGRYSFTPVKPIAWKRRVVFVDKAYWLLQDALTGEQVTAVVEQNFQFEKDTRIEFDGTCTVATSPNGARLLLIPFMDAMKPILSIGDEKPHQTYWPNGTPCPNMGIKAGKDPAPHGRGWTGRTGNKLLPAPAVTYTGTVKLPATIAIVMVPFPPECREIKRPTVTPESVDQATVWKLPFDKGALHIETSPTKYQIVE